MPYVFLTNGKHSISEHCEISSLHYEPVIEVVAENGSRRLNLWITLSVH